MWLLNNRQLANITPKVKSTIKWMKKGGLLPDSDVPDIKLAFCSNEWWLHIDGCGGGATYHIAKDKKRWKLL